MVYGDFERDPNPEEASKAPKNTYGRYKLESEQLVRDLVGAAGREHVIVRPSGVYGPTDINERVVQLFCEKALLGEQLVVNRSETTIDFTWIEDIANGLALAATHKNAANETFNMASGRGRNLGELVEILRGHSRISRRWFAPSPIRPFRPAAGSMFESRAAAWLCAESAA